MDEETPISKSNRRLAQESERRRMKEDGRSAKLHQRIIQERAEGKRKIHLSKKRRVKRGRKRRRKHS